jgi:hypothetical protein
MMSENLSSFPVQKPEVQELEAAQGPFLLVYQRLLGVTNWLAYDKEADALKMYSMMSNLGYRVAMYDSESTLVKKNEDVEAFDYAEFLSFAVERQRDQSILHTSVIDESAPYFTARMEGEELLGDIFIDKFEAYDHWRSINPSFAHAVYDISGTRLNKAGEIEEALWEKLDTLAKQMLAPFQLDNLLLSLVDNMNDEALMSTYYDFGGAQIATKSEKDV